MVKPSRRGLFRHLDVAGGTGDVARRVAKAGGARTEVTVLDINPDMLRVGREPPRATGAATLRFVAGNAEALPLPDRSFDCYTIAFGIRNVPRIPLALAEAYRVLKRGGHFLCLEFSAVDVPGLDRIYDAFSFNVIPTMGRLIAGDGEPYRYLVESIRRFPGVDTFSDMIAEAGFRRVSRHAADRRGRGDPFGLEALSAMFATIGHVVRLARAGFVLAREGVFSGVDPQSRAGRGRVCRSRWRKLIARPRATGGTAAAGGRDGPARAVLRQARPVPGDPAGCRRRRGRQGPRKPAGPGPAVSAQRRGRRSSRRPSAGRSPRPSSSFSEPVAAASIAQVHKARLTERRGRRRGRGQGHAARRRAALQARPVRHVFRGAPRGTLVAAGQAAEAGRGGGHAGPLRHHGDGLPHRGGGGLANSARTSQPIPISTCRRSTGT